MTLVLKHAVVYAREGIPVLPLHAPTLTGCTCGRRDCGSPGKHPQTRHGLRDASTDPATIAAWWKRSPLANIGLLTGTPGGLFALDLDSLEAEIRLADVLGVGLEPAGLGGLHVSTGRGLHVWYRLPEGVTIKNSAGRLGPGIDVRGDGGYVVAPPSLHASGRRYRFAGGKLEPPPQRLLAELTRSDPTSSHAVPSPGRTPIATGGQTTRYGRGVIERRAAAVLAAPEGTLNYSLLRAATTCAGYAASGEIALDDARNALLEAAVAAGHPRRSALRTIESGFERGLGRPLYRPPARIERVLSATRPEEFFG
jgi:hypothetical protein